MKEREIGGAHSTHWNSVTHASFLMGKSEGTKVLGKPRSRWEGSIKVDIKKIGEDYILDSGRGWLV